MGHEKKIENKVIALLRDSQTAHLINKIEIKYDLKGKAAGQFKVDKYGNKSLRFNMQILELNGWDEFKDTVTHEVAHLINNERNGRYKNGKRVYPHGKEWKRIMKELGVVPTTTHNYTLPDSIKKSETFTYECSCQTHELSKIRHNRMQKGVYKGRVYSLSCTKCKQKLKKS